MRVTIYGRENNKLNQHVIKSEVFNVWFAEQDHLEVKTPENRLQYTQSLYIILC